MNATSKKTKNGLTTEPVQIPATDFEFAVRYPEFIRLPKPGQLCPFTALSRSFLNSLILPCRANQFRPKVKSFCLRQRGAKTGVRLVSYQSLREFILAHVETGVVASAEKEVAK